MTARTEILLLSGGAFKGQVQIPVIRAILQEIGSLPSLIRGTSIGAENGAMTACGRLEEMAAVWGGLDDHHGIDGVKGFLTPALLRDRGIYSLSPMLREMQRRRLDAADLRCTFGAGTVIRETDEHVVLTWEQKNGPRNCFFGDGRAVPHQIDLPTGCCGSSAIAPIMEPFSVPFPGKVDKMATLSDGGHEHVGPPPPDLPPETMSVHAVFCAPLDTKAKTTCQVNSILEATIWAVEKAMHAPMFGDVALLEALAKAGARVRIYAPVEDVGGMLDASRVTLDRRLKIGERMALKPIFSAN
jgi:hypothetical protein